MIGELQVMSRLQREGYAVYLPLKDKGIDFVALRNSRAWQIQVKTSQWQKNSYFWFDLHKSKMVYSANTTYVFVPYTLPRRTFMGARENFLLIPSLHLRTWIRKGLLATKHNAPNVMNFFVYPDLKKQRWAYRNKGKELDLTKYWNNFRMVKGAG